MHSVSGVEQKGSVISGLSAADRKVADAVDDGVRLTSASSVAITLTSPAGDSTGHSAARVEPGGATSAAPPTGVVLDSRAEPAVRERSRRLRLRDIELWQRMRRLDDVDELWSGPDSRLVAAHNALPPVDHMAEWGSAAEDEADGGMWRLRVAEPAPDLGAAARQPRRRTSNEHPLAADYATGFVLAVDDDFHAAEVVRRDLERECWRPLGHHRPWELDDEGADFVARVSDVRNLRGRHLRHTFDVVLAGRRRSYPARFFPDVATFTGALYGGVPLYAALYDEAGAQVDSGLIDVGYTLRLTARLPGGMPPRGRSREAPRSESRARDVAASAVRALGEAGAAVDAAAAIRDDAADERKSGHAAAAAIAYDALIARADERAAAGDDDEADRLRVRAAEVAAAPVAKPDEKKKRTVLISVELTGDRYSFKYDDGADAATKATVREFNAPGWDEWRAGSMVAFVRGDEVCAAPLDLLRRTVVSLRDYEQCLRIISGVNSFVYNPSTLVTVLMLVKHTTEPAREATASSDARAHVALLAIRAMPTAEVTASLAWEKHFKGGTPVSLVDARAATDSYAAATAHGHVVRFHHGAAVVASAGLAAAAVAAVAVAPAAAAGPAIAAAACLYQAATHASVGDGLAVDVDAFREAATAGGIPPHEAEAALWRVNAAARLTRPAAPAAVAPTPWQRATTTLPPWLPDPPAWFPVARMTAAALGAAQEAVETYCPGFTASVFAYEAVADPRPAPTAARAALLAATTVARHCIKRGVWVAGALHFLYNLAFPGCAAAPARVGMRFCDDGDVAPAEHATSRPLAYVVSSEHVGMKGSGYGSCKLAWFRPVVNVHNDCRRPVAAPCILIGVAGAAAVPPSSFMGPAYRLAKLGGTGSVALGYRTSAIASGYEMAATVRDLRSRGVSRKDYVNRRAPTGEYVNAPRKRADYLRGVDVADEFGAPRAGRMSAFPKGETVLAPQVNHSRAVAASRPDPVAGTPVVPAHYGRDVALGLAALKRRFAPGRRVVVLTGYAPSTQSAIIAADADGRHSYNLDAAAADASVTGDRARLYADIGVAMGLPGELAAYVRSAFKAGIDDAAGAWSVDSLGCLASGTPHTTDSHSRLLATASEYALQKMFGDEGPAHPIIAYHCADDVRYAVAADSRERADAWISELRAIVNEECGANLEDTGDEFLSKVLTPSDPWVARVPSTGAGHSRVTLHARLMTKPGRALAGMTASYAARTGGFSMLRDVLRGKWEAYASVPLAAEALQRCAALAGIELAMKRDETAYAAARAALPIDCVDSYACALRSVRHLGRSVTVPGIAEALEVAGVSNGCLGPSLSRQLPLEAIARWVPRATTMSRDAPLAPPVRMLTAEQRAEVPYAARRLAGRQRCVPADDWVLAASTDVFRV